MKVICIPHSKINMMHIYALKHVLNHILESGVGSQQPLDFAGKQMLAKLINQNKYPPNTSIVLLWALQKLST